MGHSCSTAPLEAPVKARNLRMKVVSVLVLLMAVIGMSYSATSDVSPLLLRRVLRSPQSGGENTNTRIFFNNGNANSAAAGALFGGLISYAQNQIKNPCTRRGQTTTNNRIFGQGFNFGNFVAGAAAAYGTSQLATNFLN